MVKTETEITGDLRENNFGGVRETTLEWSQRQMGSTDNETLIGDISFQMSDWHGKKIKEVVVGIGLRVNRGSI